MEEKAMPITEFSPGTLENLRFYVYWLRDPRDKAVFYVGKGEGNRVFQHIKCLEKGAEPDEETDKEQRIREIAEAGLAVEHVIVRHNMDEEDALMLEAVLIDMLPPLGIPLTNQVEGHGTGDYGIASPEMLEAVYAAKELVIPDGLNVLFISANAQFRNEKGTLLERTQIAWKVDPAKAGEIHMVLVHANGLVRGCFVPDPDGWRKKSQEFPTDKLMQYEPKPGRMAWIPARKKYFPQLDKDIPGRFGFLGMEAAPDVAGEYVLRRMPEKYRKSSGQPIQYYKG
jgi:hypothetical protein